jgi:hypothetical protein
VKLNELSPKTLNKQAHSGVKLITNQYPEAAVILREALRGLMFSVNSTNLPPTHLKQTNILKSRSLQNQY